MDEKKEEEKSTLTLLLIRCKENVEETMTAPGCKYRKDFLKTANLEKGRGAERGIYWLATT